MTTSYAPRTSDVLTLTELLVLLDNMTGYGIDSHSRAELAKLDEVNEYKHVTDAKTAGLLVEHYITAKYAHLNGRAPSTDKQRDSIVRSDGFLHDATYNREDILRMLDDPFIQNMLRQQFTERTVLVQGIYIPTVVAEAHPIDPANQQQEDWYF